MEQTVRASQLESPLGWLNTDRPLRVGQELRGQVVLLDFWTYCCINCIHILPDLKYLERKYADQPLVVIGVHSAKFTNESSRQTIRAAIHRYEIEHPVIVDDQMAIWRAYGARSWPTFVVIDPEGYVALHTAGEGQRVALDQAIEQLMDHHRRKGTLADAPLKLRRDGVVRPATGLAFPGKVFADAQGRRVFIADSNHNRVVVTTLPDEAGNCDLIQTIGSGAIGRDDGPAESATFDHPQGLVLSGDTLYVADTENHLIRAVDLNTWRVTTAVGTGEMGYDRAGGAMGTQQPISTPWDLCMEGGTLYVAMAGLHQIWRCEMPIGFARSLAGTGRENIVDGPVESAALSQPSGVCLMGGTLYIADSEVSAVRGIDLAAETVFTLIGQGLFVFGDVDGPHAQARFQHPLGLTPHNGKLLVADTYNHKIKLVDPNDRTATTLYGTGRPGTATPDGGLALFEPGGLNAAGDTLFIADTNNHRVVMVDLRTHRWSELRINGLSRPTTIEGGWPIAIAVGDSISHRSPAPTFARDGAGTAAKHVIKAQAVTIATDSEIELRLTVCLPDGAHLNPEAPWHARVSRNATILAQTSGFSDSFPVAITVPPDAPAGDWIVAVSFVYCTDRAEALCIPAEVVWRVSPERAGAADQSITLAATATQHGH